MTGGQIETLFWSFIHEILGNVCWHFGVFTLCDGSMYAFQVEFDLDPGWRRQHLLPHQRDVLEARRDLFVVELQAPVLQVALRGCEVSKNSRGASQWKAERPTEKGGGTGRRGSFGLSEGGQQILCLHPRGLVPCLPITSSIRMRNLAKTKWNVRQISPSH